MESKHSNRGPCQLETCQPTMMEPFRVKQRSVIHVKHASKQSNVTLTAKIRTTIFAIDANLNQDLRSSFLSEK